MGHPCLRINEDFFASLEAKSGNMIVKLSATRVDELVKSEVGIDFAPNGRRCREWCAVPEASLTEWESLLNEARQFVEGR